MMRSRSLDCPKKIIRRNALGQKIIRTRRLSPVWLALSLAALISCCFKLVAIEIRLLILSRKREPDPERRAAVIPIFRPYQPVVRLDNGARDGQPHAHAFRLAGEKRLEDPL
jgi:hypothetical protein